MIKLILILLLSISKIALGGILSKINIYPYTSKYDAYMHPDFPCDSNYNGEFNVAKSLISEGNVIFDVGANKGEYTKAILTIADKLKIYSFEPLEVNFELLHKNINNVMQKNYSGSSIYCYNLALSNKCGVKKFFFYPQNPSSLEAGGLYYRKIITDIHGKHEEIDMQISTLDIFCKDNNIQTIDFLKIDTEGSEFDVLLGAKNLLNDKKIRIIQFEYGGTYPDAKITLKEVCKYLTHNKYVIFKIIPEGLVYLPEWHNSLENYTYSNFVAILQNLVSQELMKNLI